MPTDWSTLAVQVAIFLVSMLALSFSIWRIFAERRKSTKAHRIEVIQRFYRHLVDIDWFQCRHDHSGTAGSGKEKVVVETGDYRKFSTELYLYMLAFVGEDKIESVFDRFTKYLEVNDLDELMNSGLSLVGAKHGVWLRPSLSDDDYDVIRADCATCTPENGN